MSTSGQGPATPFPDLAVDLDRIQELLPDLEIQEPLGAGAMGVVYAARQGSLDRRVALKLISPHLAVDEPALGRFTREIRALAQCNHPNVVQIFDARPDHDPPFLLMSLVEGSDLAKVARRLAGWRGAGIHLREEHLAVAVREPDEAPPPPGAGGARGFYRKLARLFAGAAGGLAHIHERGILHRDLKPGNLRLTPGAGKLVIMDLGLAKLRSLPSMTASHLGILGTLRYVAPEQFDPRWKRLDERADIYGLGASLYELAVGRPMFDGLDETRLLRQILYGKPPTPRSIRPDLPQDLEAIILKATCRWPELRYASAGELAGDLEAFAEGRSIRAVPPGPIRRGLMSLKRRRRTVLLALATAALLLAGGLWLWSSRRIETGWYANLTYRNAAPVGVGRLDEERASRRHRSWRAGERGGRIVRVERVNGSGSLVDDELGGAIWELDYDWRGNIAGRTERDRFGRVQTVLAYTDQGRREEWRDRNGNPKPTEPTRDATVILREFDEHGFTRTERFTTAYGSPRLDTRGASGYTYQRDARGLPLRQVPLTDRGGAVVERSFDGRGSLLTEAYLSREGEPVLIPSASWMTHPAEMDHTVPGGYSSRILRYDERGNLTEVTFLGVEGEPVACHEGYHRVEHRYDPRGNQEESRFYGIDGELTLQERGIAMVRRRFDPRGGIVWEGYHGTLLEPHAAEDGWASVSRILDDRSREVEAAFYDDRGIPVAGASGYARRTRVYDQFGNCVEESYFGTDGRPTDCTLGFPVLHRWYDDLGNLRGISYRQPDGSPTLGSLGFSSAEFHLNERHRVERVEIRDPEGNLSDEHWYAVQEFEYDQRGNIVAVCFQDSQGEPIRPTGGFTCSRRTFNAMGHLVEIRYQGLRGEPVLIDKGISGYRYHRDEVGRLLETHHLGLDGQTLKVVTPE